MVTLPRASLTGSVRDTVRTWQPAIVAAGVVVVVVALFGGARGALPVDPLFGFNALAAIFAGIFDVAMAILPLILAVAAGLFLVRWWLAPDDDSAVGVSGGERPGWMGSQAATVDVTCPACATSVRDRWQACPSCGYRMHVIAGPLTCPTCHQAVDKDWKTCPHCATALPEIPDERRVPARAMVEAARVHAIEQEHRMSA